MTLLSNLIKPTELKKIEVQIPDHLQEEYGKEFHYYINTPMSAKDFYTITQNEEENIASLYSIILNENGHRMLNDSPLPWDLHFLLKNSVISFLDKSKSSKSESSVENLVPNKE